MGQKLEDIRPRRVSLVKRGANLRRILLAKSDEEQLDGFVADMLAAPVEKEDVLLAAVEKTQGDESVAKAVSTLVRAADALREPYGDSFRDAIVKAVASVLDPDADADEDGNQDDESDDDAINKAAEGEAAIYKRDFTAQQRRDLAKKGHALSDGSYPIESKADIGPALTLARSGHGDVDKAKALIKRRADELGAADQLPDNWNLSKEDTVSETAHVPVKKEDGTWDLSAVPEEQRPAIEALIKSHDDELDELRKEKETAETTASEALKIAKAEQEQRETREYIAKSETLDNLAKSDDEFGVVLRSIAKAEEAGHLPEGTSEKLDTVLKAANEQADAMFREAGRTGGYRGDTDGESKLNAAAAELRKADPSLTGPQSIAKALKADPSLYDEYQKAVA